jgi:hypothetical protein
MLKIHAAVIHLGAEEARIANVKVLVLFQLSLDGLERFAGDHPPLPAVSFKELDLPLIARALSLQTNADGSPAAIRYLKLVSGVLRVHLNEAGKGNY